MRPPKHATPEARLELHREKMRIKKTRRAYWHRLITSPVTDIIERRRRNNEMRRAGIFHYTFK